MKKVLKIIGLLFGMVLIGFGVWYYLALDVDGEPVLTACQAVDLYDDVTGEKIVGVEDMDFDYETGTIFMSAYDRRAVAREIGEGKVTTQGGIYSLKVTGLTDAPSLTVTDISRIFKKAGFEFRPHGILFRPGNGFSEVLAINRTFEEEDNAIVMKPGFVFFRNENSLWIKYGSEEFNGVCDPNDLAVIPMGLPFIGFSDIEGTCEKGHLNTSGVIKILKKDGPETIFKDLNFPNGMVSNKNYFAFAISRDNQVNLFAGENYAEGKTVSLPIAPDNLTVDDDDNLYVAGFPNLLDYYFYMQGWLGVKKSPSAAYRISPEDYKQTLLFKDDGSMISGATVALRAGDYLLLGSAWDDNIAICEGMNGLD